MAKRSRSESSKPESSKPESTGSESSKSEPQYVPIANPYVAAFLAWLIPGAGHAFVGRRGRGLIFFAVVMVSIGIGVSLNGRLPWQFSNAPLTTLATLGALGSGLPCVVLRLALDYTGDMKAAGYEYGGAFILTAGLMNLLLVLDAWDIALGRERPLRSESSEGEPS